MNPSKKSFDGMNRILRYFKSLLLLSFFATTAEGQGLQNLKNLCAPGEGIDITSPLTVSGIVVSDWRSDNVAMNPMLYEGFTDTSVSARTVYLQEADGSMGISLLFTSPVWNRLERYDHVTLDLCSCRVERFKSPDRIVVSGLGRNSVVSKTAGSRGDIASKERRLCELTDADIFTEVVIKGLEVVCKNGCWSNIYELYGQYCRDIHRDVDYRMSGRMDGWATLMRDGDGNCIYLDVNTLCPWRRDGNPVPSGVGDVRAVPVHEYNRHMGGNMGPYTLRPMWREDIMIDEKCPKDWWKTLTGWDYDGTGGQDINFEMLGMQGGVWKEGRSGDRVLNDRGEVTGYLWTDSGAKIHIDSDTDALTVENKGYQKNGAIKFKSPTTSWFEFSPDGKVSARKSILVEFSAASVQAELFRMSFSWAAGDQNVNNVHGYPSMWNAQCSTDEGRTWLTLEDCVTKSDEISLPPLPFWDRELKDGTKVVTSADACLGLQQRCFVLPSSIAGCPKVLVRLIPSGDSVMHLSDVFDAPTSGVEFMTADKTEYVTHISIGNLLIEYK